MSNQYLAMQALQPYTQAVKGSRQVILGLLVTAQPFRRHHTYEEVTSKFKLSFNGYFV